MNIILTVLSIISSALCLSTFTFSHVESAAVGAGGSSEGTKIYQRFVRRRPAKHPDYDYVDEYLEIFETAAKPPALWQPMTDEVVDRFIFCDFHREMEECKQYWNSGGPNGSARPVKPSQKPLPPTVKQTTKPTVKTPPTTTPPTNTPPTTTPSTTTPPATTPPTTTPPTTTPPSTKPPTTTPPTTTPPTSTSSTTTAAPNTGLELIPEPGLENEDDEYEEFEEDEDEYNDEENYKEDTTLATNQTPTSDGALTNPKDEVDTIQNVEETTVKQNNIFLNPFSW